MFLLLTNAKIKEGLDGILIAKEKIVKIGPSDVLKRMVGGQVELHDLKGQRIIPGLIDAHTHLIPFGLELLRPDLKPARSPDDAIDIIKDYIREKRLEGTIIGYGYDDTNWRRPLERKILDWAFPRRSVLVRRICGHITIANRSALKMIPHSVKSVDRKTGVLLERPSLNLDNLFPASDQELDLAIGLAVRKLLGLGITTIHDIISSRHLRCYMRYKGVRPRVRAYLFGRDGWNLGQLGIASRFGDESFKIMGMKIFLDGSIGARTAALSEPYLDRGGRGRLLITKQKLRAWLKVAEANSLQLMIHAIGDRAIERVVDLPIGPDNPLRHRIEHAEILFDHLLDKVKKRNLLLSLQPNFTYFWGRGGGLYEKVLGRGRSRFINRLRTVERTGLRYGLGSDTMPPDPEYVLRGATGHILKEERIDFETVIKAYTEGSSYLAFDENHLGKIEEGYYADLVVLRGRGLKASRIVFRGRFFS